MRDRPLDPRRAGPEADSPAPAAPDNTSPDADALLAAVLRIAADDAARIRDATPSRVRPHPQRGPSAEYGDPDT